MSDIVIAADDPERDDVMSLLMRHLEFAHEHSPPEDVHALDVSGLTTAAVSFFSARRDGVLLGVGALRRIDSAHAEIKSMHTAAESRGTGVGRMMVRHLLDLARSRGFVRISLETGTMAAFAPARSLYASVGFTECAPFADYFRSANSVCMTRLL